MKALTTAGGRQAAALSGFLLLQVLASVFFVGDVVWDLLHAPTSSHTVFEGLVVLALISGVAFGALALRRMLGRMAAQGRALATASGDLVAVVEAQFHRWGLTGAERDVAMLALKGLDVAEIATLRGAAPGTVRAQLTRIYAKSGLSGRAQLAAFFVEDLLGGPVGTGEFGQGEGG